VTMRAVSTSTPVVSRSNEARVSCQREVIL
jgi:hypothetical protein